MDQQKPVDLAKAQEAVADIWIEVLELDSLDPNDDFYDIGGDSLSAIQILSRIQQKFGVKLSEAELFTARTVAGLCRFLEQAKARTEVTGVPLAYHFGPRDRFPTTSSQQRLWVLDQFIANPEVYNIAYLVQMKGDLNVEALGKALQAVVERHEVFRTHLEAENGVPMQTVEPRNPTIVCPIVDLKHLPNADRLKEAEKQSVAEASRPMDLTNPPLWRFRLFVIGPDDHALSLLIHHVLTDGWSWGVFFKDLETYYNAFKEGKEPRLSPLPMQFGDFAIWQRDWMKSPAFRAQVDHWKKTLAPPVATLDLPISRPRPRMQTFHGDTIHFSLPRKLTNAIDKFGRKESVTRFMIGLAAFQTVLHRYSGQDDMLIGTPVAARNQQEIEALIGFFVNTLVLRTNLGGDPTFLELLERVRQVRLDAFTNQDIPLEALIEELQPPRDTSRQPFFQVAFLYQNVKMIPERFARMKLTSTQLHNHTSMFDLRLVMEDGPYDSLWAWIEFNTDLFDRPAMARMAQHFLNVLEAAVSNPGEKISRLPILTADERKCMVEAWNNTAGDYPREVCIHEGIEQRAQQTPDAIAVVAGGQFFTYREINERANRLARHLRANGVGRGTFVGICLQRSEEMIVAAIGVLKAGGAYVPLDSSYPKDRIAFMIEDAKAPIVLTQSELLDRLPDELKTKERFASPICYAEEPGVECAARYLCLDRMSVALSEYDASNLDRINDPDDLAYIIFTSGSTGRPKGVMLRHRPVMNVLDWVSSSFAVTPNDRLLFVTSLSFDLSVYDIFGVLGAGGSIRVASENELRDPNRLLQILKTEPITIWDSAPAALQQLLPFFALEKPDDDTNRLRLVMLSGDWIPVPLPDQVRGVFPNARMISLGGATEAAIWSNWYPIEKVDPGWPSIPYGKPIRNARYYVLDNNLQPVPIGVPGELHIGGDVLADGYWNRAELTAERFIDDPFRISDFGFRISDSQSEIRNPKCYKTGDLARFMPDGNIEFLGRIDSQVKVRGFRVEAGEIESVLSSHAAVREAVIRPHRDTSGHVYLCAYVVLREASRTDWQSELQEHLQTKLPDYMVPAHFVFLEQMPLTPNGKVDRAALLPPATSVPKARAFEEPVGPIESGVADVWREVLGLERAGRRDNFFELGGHSLRAAQLVARLQERFQVELRLPILFEKPTVAALAEAIQQTAGGSLTVIERSNLMRAPASPVQQRFWFLDRTLADPTIYHVPDLFRIRGPLDTHALEKAWNAMLARQEALRTAFVDDDGWPVQEVRSPAHQRVPVVDVTTVARAEREKQALKRFADEARKPLDLKRGEVCRPVIYKLSDNEHLLAWTIHHIVMDESSRVLLLRDLWTAYGQVLKRRSATLPELPVRYLDFSRWQREQVLSAERDAPLLSEEPDVQARERAFSLACAAGSNAVAWWKERLKGAPPPLSPPHPKPRPAQRSSQGATFAFDLSPRVSEAINTISRQAGVTPFIFTLAAFQTLMFRWTGQPDVCIGSPVSTRPGVVSDAVGCFVNTVVLRTNLEGDPTFRDLLGRARETVRGALEHAIVPFEKLVDDQKPERVPGGHPFFQTLFIYNAEDLHGTAPGGLDWEHAHTETIGSKFDLTLTIDDRPGKTYATFEYSTDLYDAETIRRYAGHVLTLLEGIAVNPDSAISELPILTAGESEKLLHQFNDSAAEYPRDKCVHQLVEEQAAQTPDAIAFVFRGQPLTFRELNERANRLAHYLRSLGVSPDTLVGVCLERSLDMPVAMLGVLKAGAAYVPLDPDFPAERLALYVSDSRMPFVVAHERLLNRVPTDSVRSVRIDADAEAIARQRSTNPDPGARPENLVYVLYTSGSTGRPNGVAIEHRSLVNLLWAFRTKPGLSARDTIMSVTTLSFDIHTVETWLPMVVGAKSVIVPREIALDGRRLGDLIQESNATVFQSTPATWRLLLMAGWKGKRDLRGISGGEALTLELLEQLSVRLAELWNIYGPTETTVYSIGHKTGPTDRAILIGKPVANNQVYILDPNQRPVPIGCVGEIWIGGDGVARGYLGREELTTSRFRILDLGMGIGSPKSEIRNPKSYKTGDLGRYLPDGSIECLGRIDHQVKVRGFRIELSEIERVMEENQAIAQAVVIARKDNLGAALHAYYRLQPKQSTTPADLRQFIQARLPEYMVPATFTVLDAFPQTPNGKVDRKALPDPTPGSGRPARTHIPPTNEVERDLVVLWEDVLGVKPIGIDDDFHELGGHSLIAAVLMAKIESRLGYHMPIEALFQKPTVRGLAEAIQTRLELGKGVLVPLQTGGSHPPLFMIAGAGGHVFAFHKFARMLGPDFPAYGMKAIGVDGSEKPLERFEEIAARYVKEITEVRPDGPITIGGYSVGGRIALETALQLESAGRDVPMVLIFDMFAPGSPKLLPLPRRLAFHARSFFRKPRGEKKAYLKERLYNIYGRVLRLLKLEKYEAPRVPDLDIVPQNQLRDVWGGLVRGSERYVPIRKFRGKIVLIRTEEPEDWHGAICPEPMRGWDRWSVQPVEVRTIDAEHLELFKDEHQQQMAAHVREVIEAASGLVAETPQFGL